MCTPWYRLLFMARYTFTIQRMWFTVMFIHVAHWPRDHQAGVCCSSIA